MCTQCARMTKWAGGTWRRQRETACPEIGSLALTAHDPRGQIGVAKGCCYLKCWKLNRTSHLSPRMRTDVSSMRSFFERNTPVGHQPLSLKRLWSGLESRKVCRLRQGANWKKLKMKGSSIWARLLKGTFHILLSNQVISFLVSKLVCSRFLR